MIYRFELLQKLAKIEKDRILYVLDTLLKDAQNLKIQKELTI